MCFVFVLCVGVYIYIGIYIYLIYLRYLCFVCFCFLLRFSCVYYLLVYCFNLLCLFFLLRDSAFLLCCCCCCFCCFCCCCCCCCRCAHFASWAIVQYLPNTTILTIGCRSLPFCCSTFFSVYFVCFVSYIFVSSLLFSLLSNTSTYRFSPPPLTMCVCVSVYVFFSVFVCALLFFFR